MKNIGKNSKIASHHVEEKTTHKLKQVIGPVDLEVLVEDSKSHNVDSLWNRQQILRN